jgi:WD40 repeat protein
MEFRIPLRLIDTRDGPGEAPATAGSLLRINVSVTDNDQPSNSPETYGVLWGRDRPAAGERSWVVMLHLARPSRFALAAAPVDAAIDPETGVFRWTPPAGPFEQRVVVVENGEDDLNRRAQRVINLVRTEPGAAVSIAPEPAAPTSAPLAILIEIPEPSPAGPAASRPSESVGPRRESSALAGPRTLSEGDPGMAIERTEPKPTGSVAELSAASSPWTIARYADQIGAAERATQSRAWDEADRLLDDCPPSRRGWEWRYLKRLIHRTLAPINPDSSKPVDPSQWRPLHTFSGLGGTSGTAFSPDGHWVAVGSTDKLAHIWNVQTGKPLKILTGHTDQVHGVLFSPDGKRIATTGFDQTARFWDAASGRMTRSLPFSALTLGESFRPDGKRVSLATFDGANHILETATGREVLVLRHAEGLGTSNSPSTANPWRVVTKGPDGDCVIWDADTGKPLRTIRTRHQRLRSQTLSPGAPRLATTGSGKEPDRAIHVWDTTSGGEVAALQRDGVDPLTAEFSPDGRFIATGAMDGTIQIWELATSRELVRIRGHSTTVWDLAFSPDGQFLASCANDGTMKVWKLALEPDPVVGRRPPVPPAPSGTFLHGLGISSDSMRCVSAYINGSIRIWSLETGHIQVACENPRAEIGPLRWLSADFGPDGRYVAGGGPGGIARIWRSTTGKLAFELKGAHREVYQVAFSPDGNLVATAGWEGGARLWSLKDGHSVGVIGETSNTLSDVEFSPDGNLVALSGDRSIKLFDRAKGVFVQTLTDLQAIAQEVTFSADGKLIAATGHHPQEAQQSSPVCLWEAATGTLRWRRTNPGRGFGVSFSPDGSRLAVAFGFVTMIYDSGTGEKLLTLEGHHAAAFSPDGRWLVTSTRIYDGAWPILDPSKAPR